MLDTEDSVSLQDLFGRLNFQRAYTTDAKGRDFLFRVTGATPDLLALQNAAKELGTNINFVIAPHDRMQEFSTPFKSFKFTTLVGWLSGSGLQLMPFALVASDKINLGTKTTK